jgi:hypothetical protein
VTATESGVGQGSGPARPGPAESTEPPSRLDILAAGVLPDSMRQLSPRWVAVLFGVGAILLVPWIFYLGFELPEQNIARHWDLTWVGFDIALLLAMARTGWLAWKGRRQMELPAVAAGTLLLVDAWFDITTSGTTSDLIQAIVSAVVIEIPLAALAFWIALHVETVCAQAARRLRVARETEAARNPCPPG